jgi:hypothetical protein
VGGGEGRGFKTSVGGLVGMGPPSTGGMSIDTNLNLGASVGVGRNSEGRLIPGATSRTFGASTGFESTFVGATTGAGVTRMGAIGESFNVGRLIPGATSRAFGAAVGFESDFTGVTAGVEFETVGAVGAFRTDGGVGADAVLPVGTIGVAG